MAKTEDPSAEQTATDEWRSGLYEATPEREGEVFSTISGVENEPLYTPDNVDLDYERDLGYPGVHPFTRGVYPSMYRGRLWTMRQFAGFGTAAETNERFRYLLDHGQTGLSTGAGAGVHARRRLRLRRRLRRARPRRGRLRAAALLLLQRPSRLLRGDREVPGRAADLGARAPGPIRREEPALVADALPHPDGRGLAHGPAARGQPDPDGARGARGGARRDAVAPHELLRRGARTADRERRP